MKKKKPIRKPKNTAPQRKQNALDLRLRLEELEATLGAIRSGEVDALIVNGPNGDHVYSLKGAEQPYRQFIECMGEGAVTVDSQGTILYCNKRFADMLQVRLEKIISTSLLTCIAEPQRHQVLAMLASKHATSENFSLLLKKSRTLPVRLAVSSLESDEGGTHCVVVTDLTDFHEKKNLAEALSKLQTSQNDLQKQFKQLEHARHQLEAANTAKDEFLAALSHELRTPLTPVLLTANALAVDPSLPVELRSDLDMIRRNVELEARLIDDLLDITRISRGKLTIAPFPVDLHATLALAIDICQSDTAAKRLRFITKLDAPHHHVNAEAVRLQQVFWNLIRNAVKFTPPGGEITIATSSSPATRKNQSPIITITVSDTGIGIPQPILKTIFNAFEQGSGEITRRFGGLGLGLTITKRLVELHGGSISATSSGHGKGSAFTVTFPSIPAPAKLHLTPSNGSHKHPPASLRILLVEDHQDTRRNMTRLLTALSHTVVPAPDSTTALKIAAEQPFDIVISDIGLPDESGLDLMKKLRARHQLRGICLSGYGMEEDIAKSLAAGFSQHLTKPINFERLEAALSQATS